VQKSDKTRSVKARRGQGQPQKTPQLCLVLEALSISEVEGSIHHFGRFQGELVESLAAEVAEV